MTLKGFCSYLKQNKMCSAMLTKKDGAKVAALVALNEENHVVIQFGTSDVPIAFPDCDAFENFYDKHDCAWEVNVPVT